MLKKHIIPVFLIAVLAGCIYRPQLQQGKVIATETTKQLRVGMQRDQIIKVMGKPVMTNLYRGRDLIYVYTLQDTRGTVREARQLFVYFHHNVVTRIKTFGLPHQIATV